MERKKAQIWVETVVYTLIGISIIGLLLAVAKPRIDEIRDRLVIEQTIESFNQIHGRILEVQDAPGNQRTLGLKLSRGKIVINSSDNSIIWQMQSNYKYSEPGSIVDLGKIMVRTEQANPYDVFIMLEYTYNITLEDETILEIEPSPTPYTLIFINRGGNNINLVLK
jgi:type II secretory pathway pseudopilin PulG